VKGGRAKEKEKKKKEKKTETLEMGIKRQI